MSLFYNRISLHFVISEENSGLLTVAGSSAGIQAMQRQRSSQSTMVHSTSALGVNDLPEKRDASDHLTSDDLPATLEGGEDDYKYVTGFKLVIVMVSVTLVAFVMMLDLSIVSTVSCTKSRVGEIGIPTN